MERSDNETDNEMNNIGLGCHGLFLLVPVLFVVSGKHVVHVFHQGNELEPMEEEAMCCKCPVHI